MKPLLSPLTKLHRAVGNTMGEHGPVSSESYNQGLIKGKELCGKMLSEVQEKMYVLLFQVIYFINLLSLKQKCLQELILVGFQCSSHYNACQWFKMLSFISYSGYSFYINISFLYF